MAPTDADLNPAPEEETGEEATTGTGAESAPTDSIATTVVDDAEEDSDDDDSNTGLIIGVIVAVIVIGGGAYVISRRRAAELIREGHAADATSAHGLFRR